MPPEIRAAKEAAEGSPGMASLKIPATEESSGATAAGGLTPLVGVSSHSKPFPVNDGLQQDEVESSPISALSPVGSLKRGDLSPTDGISETDEIEPESSDNWSRSSLWIKPSCGPISDGNARVAPNRSCQQHQKTINTTTSSNQPVSCHLTSPPSLTIPLNLSEEAPRSTGVVGKCDGDLTPCGKQVTTDDATLPKSGEPSLKVSAGEGVLSMDQPSSPSPSQKLAFRGRLGLESAVGSEYRLGATTTVSSSAKTPRKTKLISQPVSPKQASITPLAMAARPVSPVPSSRAAQAIPKDQPGLAAAPQAGGLPSENSDGITHIVGDTAAGKPSQGPSSQPRDDRLKEDVELVEWVSRNDRFERVDGREVIYPLDVVTNVGV